MTVLSVKDGVRQVGVKEEFVEKRLDMNRWGDFFPRSVKSISRSTIPMTSCGLEMTFSRITLVANWLRTIFLYSRPWSNVHRRLPTRKNQTENHITAWNCTFVLNKQILWKFVRGWCLCRLSTTNVSPFRRWNRTKHPFSRCVCQRKRRPSNDLKPNRDRVAWLG